MGNFGRHGSIRTRTNQSNSPGTGFRSTCIDSPEGGLALLRGSPALLMGVIIDYLRLSSHAVETMFFSYFRLRQFGKAALF